MPTEVLSYYLKNKDRKVRLGFQVILQCAPFLKGLKVSGLISMENESYSELEEMSKDIQSKIIKEVEDLTKDKLWKENEWIADYRRLRVVAHI